MSNEEQLKKVFEDVLALFEVGDEEEFEQAYEKIKQMGLEFIIETEESEEWDESQIDGYSEFPTVTQQCKLFLGGVLVNEWERQFGIEMLETLGGGRWSPFRLDDNEGSYLEAMLERIEIEIFDPVVPEPTTC
jgi:hypothetical protein